MSRNGKPKSGNTVKDFVKALLEDLFIEVVAWNAVFIQNRAKPAKGMPKIGGGKGADSGAAGVCSAGPAETFAGLEFGLSAELGVAGFIGVPPASILGGGGDEGCQQNVCVFKGLLN